MFVVDVAAENTDRRNLTLAVMPKFIVKLMKMIS
jgi:hypothetical protein